MTFTRVADAPEYVIRKLNERLTYADKFGTFDHLAVITTAKGTDDTGETYYKVQTYKKETSYLLRGKQDLEQVKEFLGDFENVQTISGDNLALITNGDK